MIRIGLAYNQKPEPDSAPRTADAESSRAEDEPPSNRRDASSRTTHRAAPGSGARASAVSPPLPSQSPPAASSARSTPRSSIAALPSALTGALAVPTTAAPQHSTLSHSTLSHSTLSLTHAGAEDTFAEWDSAETIDAVARALAELGEVVRLEATEEFPERLRATRPALVFNITEGLHGANREAHVPAICEFFGIPYSASDPFTLSLCLDKARAKEVLAYHGVPTAPFAVVHSERDLPALRERLCGPSAAASRWTRMAIGALPGPDANALAFPLFVKPVHEGSSKGITERNLCHDWSSLEEMALLLLERYAQPVLVEAYLPGAEFTCAVLGNGDAVRLLPIVGMNFTALPEGALPVYGFEAKWLWDTAERPLEIFECPARLDTALQRSVEAVVLQAYRVLGCRDWARIDVRLDAAGVPNVVEVNPLPGILPDPRDNSCLPKAARAAGMSYDELIRCCARAAATRQGIPLPPVTARRLGRAAALG